MYFPDFLEPYRARSQQRLKSGVRYDIEFSGPTYHVQIDEDGSTYYIFLQLEEGSVKDIFCTCETSSQKGSCEHMALASLLVFDEGKDPIHVLFQRSLCRALFYELFKKLNFKDPVVKKLGAEKYAIGDKHEVLCTLKVHNMQEKLYTLFESKKVETEETSIKFSNLSEDELLRWREGRPSIELRFELSILSDLAKLLFLQKPSVHFEEAGNSFDIQLESSVLSMHVQIDKQMLEELIPTLPYTYKSNLQLFSEQDATITSITFDEKKGILTIQRKQEVASSKKGKNIGPYRYVKDVGFFIKDEHVAPHEVLKDPQEIALFLKRNSDVVKQLVPEISWHEEPRKVLYDLSVDRKGVLHIQGYLFQKGDLASAHIFGTYVYLKKAIYVIEALKFGKVHMSIDQNELSDFLLLHREWISLFDGFCVHLKKPVSNVTYMVDANGNLSFERKVKDAGFKKAVDLGKWLYIEKQGFYFKESVEAGLHFQKGHAVPSHMVGSFIRKNTLHLEEIPEFFMKECPVHNLRFHIYLKKKGVIETIAEYDWIDMEDEKKARFYDEYVFIPEKGFYRLPTNLRPLQYIKEIHVDNREEWNAFFQEQLPRLQKEFPCRIDPRLEHAELQALVIHSKKAQEEKKKKTKKPFIEPLNMDVDLSFQSKRAAVPLFEIFSAIERGERFLPTDAGVIDVTQERFHWMNLLKKRHLLSKKGIRFTPIDFLRLQAYENITVDSQDVETKIVDRLFSLKAPDEPVYPDLKSDLRTYQKNGVSWLWFLYQNHLSGLLCDDMGVGKTHQAMGLMAAIDHSYKNTKKRGRFLVVCPTSLIYHWEDKLKRFLPTLRVKAYVGPTRTLDDFEKNYDVVVTTYGLIRNEWKKFSKFEFDVAFFDELQIAKNHVSQIYAALTQMKAQMKVGLTGTPIENQLRELKALFDLVLPGYMPDEADFREYFVRPIEKEDGSARRALLSRLVKPFVLRRRKQDVLSDLPEKTEELAFAELQGEQKSLYHQVASLQVQPLIQLLKDDSSPIPYMHIFALISSLKQICNHPAAYLNDVDNYERYESGKWDAFVELIEEARESQQKVVVFSQYLAMLDIIELFLKKNSIGYAQIRGGTRLRGEEIERFHKDPKCEVFIGSLQAAGLGIDLTPASVVIHYDRWWNAARENQATDRVHRFGQTRGVQVFKLMTKHTIEEKIDQMIVRKSNLLEDIVSFDDHQVVKKLSRQEIIALLDDLKPK